MDIRQTEIFVPRHLLSEDIYDAIVLKLIKEEGYEEYEDEDGIVSFTVEGEAYTFSVEEMLQQNRIPYDLIRHFFYQSNTTLFYRPEQGVFQIEESNKGIPMIEVSKLKMILNYSPEKAMTLLQEFIERANPTIKSLQEY